MGNMDNIESYIKDKGGSKEEGVSEDKMPDVIAHVRATAAVACNEVKVMISTAAAVFPPTSARALVSHAAAVAAHNHADCEAEGSGRLWRWRQKWKG